MFTIRQNTAFGLTKSGLKWDIENAGAPTDTESLIKLAKSKLDDA